MQAVKLHNINLLALDAVNLFRRVHGSVRYVGNTSWSMIVAYRAVPILHPMRDSVPLVESLPSSKKKQCLALIAILKTFQAQVFAINAAKS